MKKIRIPLMIQDQRVAKLGRMKSTEGYDPIRGFFLDGPITEKVAVLDFDPKTGKLRRGARYNPGKKRGWYENPAGMNLYEVESKEAEIKELYKPAFMQVSVFATVLRTIDLFEKKDTLGRPLEWAFDAPQLLVIPRAGEQANAYYHRDTHSLQFFSFLTQETPRNKIYTCLSRDIVAHETGHAIVDGVAPDLLDASSPQSLAIHEAMADLVALLMAFSSHNLSAYLLRKGNGSIEGQNPFTTIAEEFGVARGHGDGLRSLHNKKTLDPNGGEHYVGRTEPHALSEVLSGALFSVMVKIHDDLKTEYAQRPLYAERKDPLFSASGEALRKGAERFKRMTFRSLDYLPPGEISFADLGRAIIAVDKVAYPDNPKMRRWVGSEFMRRRMVQTKTSLNTPTNFKHKALEKASIDTLYASDWAAYEFANSNRRFLGIPAGIPFQIRPRLSVEKQYDYDRKVRECIFKVAWDQTEDNRIGDRFPSKRKITVGTTLAIDWETGHVLSRLTNARPPGRIKDRGKRPLRVRKNRLAEHRQQKRDRDEFLKSLVGEDILKVGRHAIGPDGQPLLFAVRAEESEGLMRLRGTANMLHIARAENG